MPLSVEQKELLNILPPLKFISHTKGNKSKSENNPDYIDHWILLENRNCGIIKHYVQAEFWVWFLIEEIHILKSQIYEKLDPTLYETIVLYNSEFLVEVD